ncbi:hypothetical protein R3O04_015530 [Bacteroides hominis]|uniref:hypothetical protein n=2 Tax=Bacteroides hominis TaxID=2763023 RepID=UPI002948D08D|nr:hypothetical protein [Bacteroides hominis (ex Liu et al. 2022)]MCE8619000.1 hypothetical protein [Bacteroides fragilis]MDV6172730.1 hypothetical protein [Bacteroides hominis (ex Liu et al. 2022)]
MKLREEIEPKIIQIEKICPQISRLLRGYDSEKDNKCLNIIKKISELTHKVITKDILSEYMEDDSICMVALRLSIGTPPLLHIPLSCDELLEIIQRIHSKNNVEYKVKAFPEDELWWVLSHDYYVPLLEKNMELSEPSLIREMLYQETVFDSLRYKPEEVLEKILGVMK